MAISRDAMLIYLKDLRTLETIVNESTGKKNQLISKRDELKPKVITIEEPPKPTLPDKPHAGFKVGILIGILLLIRGVLALFSGSVLDTEAVFVLAVCFFIPGSILLAVFIPLQIKQNRSYEEEMRSYNYQVEEYEKRMKEYEQRSRQIRIENADRRNEVEQQKQEMTKASDEIQEDIDTYRKMLEEAYRADIIPLQFRSIEGIYYLYDFLSTSQLTLTDALMHADLQAIKDKLDAVIQLQKENIIQQAETNARLEDIQRSNQDILETARSTENNTAVAAQYARIAAVNSQMSVKLQSKQLAYQRADFWLK